MIDKRRTKMEKGIFLALVVGFVGLFALNGTAMAQGTDTANLNINATVNAVGRIISVGDINFGAYDPTDTNPLDANGSVQYRVAKGVDYWVYISETSPGVREMAGASLPDTLAFDLYTDAPGGTRWGETQATGISGTSVSNASVTSTIYGRVAALQNVGVDTYSETLVITLEF
jgi:spore coat protein U-like protein